MDDSKHIPALLNLIADNTGRIADALEKPTNRGMFSGIPVDENSLKTLSVRTNTMFRTIECAALAKPRFIHDDTLHDWASELEQLSAFAMDIADESTVQAELEEFSGDADGIDYKPKYEAMKAALQKVEEWRFYMEKLCEDKSYPLMPSDLSSLEDHYDELLKEDSP